MLPIITHPLTVHYHTGITFKIDVSRTMVDDHLISSGYRRIFLSLMRDFHKDDHFSFESKGTDKSNKR